MIQKWAMLCRYTSDPAKQNVFKKIELFQVKPLSPNPLTILILPLPLLWP